MRHWITASAVVLLAACSGGDGDETAPSPATEGDPMATRPAGETGTLALEGRLEEGTECMVLHTPDGERWAIGGEAEEFAPGDYVELVGVRADASFCMEGEGTLIPQSMSAMQPPAADRDPARAGGVALTEAYVTGSWTAPGVAADCSMPDFQITASPSETLVIETRVNGSPETGRVVLGDYPRIDWDDPLPDMPIESRGPDGLAVLRPATDADYETVEIAGEAVIGDGVEFIKCG
ncbi:DUF5818 domain-containing protein [Aurantiacibacter poecillastricola]|uniref:DUF5818 domain-containing protein n=1 Tax=Aurantiacibacter poecillastricola TaxID=3064385 RepID=UPI00273FB3C2|nr:DUF5818 domain-containing protein [Aurantiacibacter sp. 219JJ12-13]MDP5261767.1 DUF5818 domain-containing protein [Aurantiacibacter sp. 219JJ12-13]